MKLFIITYANINNYSNLKFQKEINFILRKTLVKSKSSNLLIKLLLNKNSKRAMRINVKNSN